MITIISGTNRLGNKSMQLAQWYQHTLQRLGESAKLFNLEELPDDFLLASRYAEYDRSPAFLAIQEEYFFPADKFIFIMPEYNGSIPGILKLVIDSCEVEQAFYHKKACLTGLSSGRAGNLRGMDHLTNILNYLKIQVYHNKLPVSRIFTEMDKEGQLLHASTQQNIEEQLTGFLSF